MSNFIGQNPARDIEAKERIEKKFRNKKIAVSLIYAVVGAVGLISNPGAVIKLKSQAKKDLESWKKKAWNTYVETGDINKALSVGYEF